MSDADWKKLAVLSRNRCAFTGCPTPLVDEAADVVVGEIAHIRAQSPGGPRYDPAYPAGLIHAAENLMLMCPTHHTLIDKAPDAFPVEALLMMRESHTNAAEADEATVERIARELLLLGIGTAGRGQVRAKIFDLAHHCFMTCTLERVGRQESVGAPDVREDRVGLCEHAAAIHGEDRQAPVRRRRLDLRPRVARETIVVEAFTSEMQRESALFAAAPRKIEVRQLVVRH